MSSRFILSNSLSRSKKRVTRSSSKSRTRLKQRISSSPLKKSLKTNSSVFSKSQSPQPFLKPVCSFIQQKDPIKSFLSHQLDLQDSHPTLQEQFKAYQEIFQELIKKNPEYGFLLRKVKWGYQGFLQSTVSTLNSRMAQVKNRVKAERQCVQNLKERWSLSLEVKKMENKEMKYVELLNEIQNRGYPVSQIYEKSVRKMWVRTPSSSTQSQRSDLGRPSIPKLTIPESAEGFQEEFMGKFDEFSESWKGQIQYQKR